MIPKNTATVMKSIKSFITYSLVDTYRSKAWKGVNFVLPYTTLSPGVTYIGSSGPLVLTNEGSCGDALDRSGIYPAWEGSAEEGFFYYYGFCCCCC